LESRAKYIAKNRGVSLEMGHGMLEKSQDQMGDGRGHPQYAEGTKIIRKKISGRGQQVCDFVKSTELLK